MYPDFKGIGHNNLLRLQGSVQQQVDLTLAPELQPAREQFNSNGQFVKVAPHHQPGQSQEHVVSKEEPD